MSEATGQKMVNVSVEVRSGTGRFRVGVQAKSIREALAVVGCRYPQGEVGVVFPIASEGYFVEGYGARAGLVEQPKELAA